MQAIQTKYLGPTDHYGARIKAICAAKARIFHYDHSLENFNNHREAAYALRDELEWKGELASGQLADGSWAHCFIEKENEK